MRRYIAHLKEEIREFFRSDQGGRINSVYLGGGTPSILSPDQIEDILSEFPRDRFSMDFECTLEANPEDITEEWAAGISET